MIIHCKLERLKRNHVKPLLSAYLAFEVESLTERCDLSVLYIIIPLIIVHPDQMKG